jgi:hypothetical protein
MISLDELKKIETAIIEFKETNFDSIQNLIIDLKKLESTSLEWDSKRDPQWRPENHNEYYDDKKQLQRFSIEEFYAKIENTANTRSLSEINSKTDELISLISLIQKEISIKLFFIDDDSVSKVTRELYQKIKETCWEKNYKKYITPRIPPVSKVYFVEHPLMVKKMDVMDICPLHIQFFAEVRCDIEILENIIDLIESWSAIIYQTQQLGYVITEPKLARDVDLLLTILNGFHSFATALQTRTHNGAPLTIQTEYDVQYLLRGLLKIFYSDVRDEEYTPSYAGSSTRVDFLLKNEKIIVEVKKTRDGLNDKKVGDELIIDFDHYQVHPDCKTLVCFVYDPEHRLKNPTGLINDLNSKSNEKCSMYTIIVPIA